MFEIIPDYYLEFNCIADKCRHTCCAGWEIDIDEVSLARFQKDGIAHIDYSDEPHFILTENERCPYLNENNLCELIIDYGEDYICQICTDHPRFRNFWETLTETGLGLCCEEAARIILLRDKEMKLIEKSGTDIGTVYNSLPDDEKYLWNVRNELLKKANEHTDKMQCRLHEYLIFRHIPDALYDGLLDERIKFVEKCFDDISEKWSTANSIEEKLEIARAFSEEIEYDTDAINDFLNSI